MQQSHRRPRHNSLLLDKKPHPNSENALALPYPKSTKFTKLQTKKTKKKTIHPSLNPRKGRRMNFLFQITENININLHGDKTILNHDFFRQKVSTNGGLVLVVKLLVHILNHKRSFPNTEKRNTCDQPKKEHTTPHTKEGEII